VLRGRTAKHARLINSVPVGNRHRGRESPLLHFFAILWISRGGNAEFLVSGDRDLLALAGKTDCLIEIPDTYRRAST
jgi:hypothetical protein